MGGFAVGGADMGGGTAWCVYPGEDPAACALSHNRQRVQTNIKGPLDDGKNGLQKLLIGFYTEMLLPEV